jgi:hypothetical protein
MANRHLDEPDPEPPQVDAAVDDYLAILAKDLPGPPGPKAAALEEVRDGLNEAIASGRTRGLPPAVATRQALVELGSTTTVGEAFAPELATAQARRTLMAFLITGPLVGVWWLLLLPSRLWPPRPETLWSAIPALPLLGVAVAAAVVILATTGSMIRWLPESNPRQALLGAAGVAVGALIGDLSVLTTVMIRLLATDWHPNATIEAVAVTASLIRVPCATWALVRSRATLQHLQRIGTTLPTDRT